MVSPSHLRDSVPLSIALSALMPLSVSQNLSSYLQTLSISLSPFVYLVYTHIYLSNPSIHPSIYLFFLTPMADLLVPPVHLYQERLPRTFKPREQYMAVCTLYHGHICDWVRNLLGMEPIKTEQSSSSFS